MGAAETSIGTLQTDYVTKTKFDEE